MESQIVIHFVKAAQGFFSFFYTLNSGYDEFYEKIESIKNSGYNDWQKR
jgi:hypothetical protein